MIDSKYVQGHKENKYIKRKFEEPENRVLIGKMCTIFKNGMELELQLIQPTRY